MPFLFVFFWIVFALIGYGIGQYKGRPLAGFLWGLLLGPIGWLVILTSPDYRAKCPDCGGVIIPGARKCKNCGSVLPSINTSHIPSGEIREPLSGGKICPICKVVSSIPTKRCSCGYTWPSSQCRE